ncbi:uncharacterized protein LOC127170781 [Labeo rohita]|uniref:uncharacterized protein LOC127170781 n=1 Tax=Labeo rohita TaxID=84645 RepID=UPI0021E3060E|nr:uncharacterized protein LOC127170781 [Labeo rohita]
MAEKRPVKSKDKTAVGRAKDSPDQTGMHSYARKHGTNTSLITLPESEPSTPDSKRSRPEPTLGEVQDNIVKILVEKMKNEEACQQHIDVSHRVGGKNAEKTRPVIIRFVARSIRDLIWKNARGSEYLKSRKFRFGEDLTTKDKDMEARNKLWPQIDAAHKKGKRAFYAGAKAIIDGKETCQRLQDETARLAELKTELLCRGKVASQWLSDVKEWAAGETPDTSNASRGATHRGLQQSIEGLYLSVRQRKQTLYRQNDSSKFRHRLQRKLAEDKKLLLQEIEKYNGLVLDSASNIDVAVVEHSLTGESTVSQIWPWEVHGSANILIKKQLHDQVMLTMRLQEEKSILVLEMAQHCTWLQSLAVVLKNKIAEEDVDKGNEGLCCLLRRRLSDVSERLQVSSNSTRLL